MTIEVQRPELEALIRDWMKTGAFATVEDALLQALKSSPLPTGEESGASNGRPALTGADLVTAMQASPYKEIDLEPARERLPVRHVGF